MEKVMNYLYLIICLLLISNECTTNAQTSNGLLEYYLNATKLKNNSISIKLEELHFNLLQSLNSNCKESFDKKLIKNISFHSQETLYDKNNLIHLLDNNCLDYELLRNISNANDLYLLDSILIQYSSRACNELCVFEIKQEKRSWKTWLYGLCFVTLINTSSLVGAILIPFANKSFYKKLLMFLIALAIGSLAGSGFLHLIPQAYGIVDDETYSKNHVYVWKGCAIMSGVYLFYLVERILKLLILKRNLNKNHTTNHPRELSSLNALDSLQSYAYVKTHEQQVDPSVEMRTRLNEDKHDLFSNGHAHAHSHFNTNKNINLDNNNDENDKYITRRETIAPVAWMIIFGDGLHNFIDGLSIGAAFCESPLKGISICIAVICEEFPHELGDFAILINAGMSYKMALLFNFLSACACYIGLCIGITIGENSETNKWIYAIAGGMFIYIALCDMIPELNESGHEIERDYFKQLKNSNDESKDFSQERFWFKIKLMLTQNVGILIGFGLMLLMAYFGDRISFY